MTKKENKFSKVNLSSQAACAELHEATGKVSLLYKNIHTLLHIYKSEW